MTNNPSTETKREAFIRVATRRTRELIKKIRILGNSSNRTNYKYSDEDVDKIFNAIEKSLVECKSQFKRNHKAFKL